VFQKQRDCDLAQGDDADDRQHPAQIDRAFVAGRWRAQTAFSPLPGVLEPGGPGGAVGGHGARLARRRD
jgi:hypothetical protein